MLRLDGEVVYAASDLNDFLACPHKLALNALGLETRIAAPPSDPTLAIIARKGALHERAALARLEAEDRHVVRVDEGDGSLRATRAAAERTVALMRAGADVIYQATLADSRWSGRADFLVRVDVPSRLGAWSYDVADAKLAIRERAAFVVQLCVYADLVAAVQGVLPARLRALYGDGREETYDPAHYVAYVRAARARLEAAAPVLDPHAVPDRVGACEQCAWLERCDAQRKRVDHLSQVAGIRRGQIARLDDVGITTLAALAVAPTNAKPAGIGDATFATLRRQARLQRAHRESGIARYELLAPRGGCGFALLPAPDPADVYFDMEGDPLYEPGRGLEYLFGAYVDGPERGYRAEWGETRDEERLAFERFIDWLVAYRRRHPGAHVYHYASYEKSALRRLAMQHGTLEAEVDALLRGGVLVDLYAVVKGALAQSHDGYSIKKLETFYGFGRDAEVRKGDQSIVAFEQYLMDPGRDSALRAAIVQYNEEDCVSTHALHRWLVTLRDEAREQFGEVPEWRAPIDPKEPTEAERARDAELDARQRKLLEAPEGEPRRLLANLLAYHRREDKPVWWAYFDRLERYGGFDPVEDDDETLGGLTLRADVAPYKVGERDRNFAYTYSYPPQQFKLGIAPVDLASGLGVDIVRIDDDARTVAIKRAESSPHPVALGPGGPMKREEQKDALARFADAVLDGSAAARFPAALSLLHREIPRLRGRLPGLPLQPAIRPGAEAIDPRDVASLVLDLDRSALVVQGPPGTGKSYAGGHVIADLLAAGKRVGVTSNSHHAIHNLLRSVERAAASRDVVVRGVKKCSGKNVESRYTPLFDEAAFDNVGTTSDFSAYNLVAGTSWLFAHKDLAPVDVLVIDEAGQVSLADAIAMAVNAENVLLLGDPLQLAHVSLGTHPEGAAASILTHLLGDTGTIAGDRGVFLDRTFRMHPALCGFISELVYDGRLGAAASCARQRIESPWFDGAGLRYVPVEHAGNAQSSPEEVEAVGEIVCGLLGGTFVDAEGHRRTIGVDDILVVSPYNVQVAALRRALQMRFGAGVRVGTVDKFQGQEAAVVIYSLAASSAEDAPRGADFLLEENRFNVAVSRGRALAVLVCSPRILATSCTTVAQLRAASSFCAFAERAEPIDVPPLLPGLIPA
ncbi:nuclease [Vulcanimicrobium alpinum]|uniref:Nuclease n=1 Tax=Vulcanimicrobium alpinum TaxID=3016050 RepID=A0AAN2CB36_UNVUL|nr:TM0106 family RecB-like putative nuclease [Vulcanimicrobium alpinum]BDE07558.1 nuclease [Vulcanimicrobium alpinum]